MAWSSISSGPIWCSAPGPDRGGGLRRNGADHGGGAAPQDRGIPAVPGDATGVDLDPVPFPDPLVGVLEKIGGVLAPIALVSVGYQLRLSGLRGASAPLASGLVFKLVLGPAAMALLFVGGLHASGELAQVTIFEAAMGPQIGGAIVAMENGLNPRLVGLMVGVGIPLSILTASIWSLLLHAV